MKMTFNPKDMKAAIKYVFDTNPAFQIWTETGEFAHNLMIQGAKAPKTEFIQSGGFAFLYDRSNPDDVYVDILVSPQFGNYSHITLDVPS
jgi:hypothetical protein